MIRHQHTVARSLGEVIPLLPRTVPNRWTIMATHTLPLRVWPVTLAGWLAAVALVAPSPHGSLAVRLAAAVAAGVTVMSAVMPECRLVRLVRLAGTVGLALLYLVAGVVAGPGGLTGATLLLDVSWALAVVAEVVIHLLSATVTELRRARRGLGRSPTGI